MNVAIVTGQVLSKPNERQLDSGDYATAFDVVTEGEEGRLTVPVNWITTVRALVSEGDEVLVVGKVRRRFFQAGGHVQSRTEVLAESVVATRRKVAVRKALEAAIGTIHEAHG
ncbi:MAG: single-stranded DNA-binding protein [Acidobacteria bacterium]|nr:single-stranded DNA-binding protein [Acidobacteriota bacterium]